MFELIVMNDYWCKLMILILEIAKLLTEIHWTNCHLMVFNNILSTKCAIDWRIDNNEPNTIIDDYMV